jgi:hypothetical protein
MPKDLLENFESEEAEATADNDPVKDITLEDLGEDKELNTPPEAEKDQAEDEPEEDKSEETETPEEKKEAVVQEAAKTEAEKTTEAVLKYLGMDSPLKIKGREYKLSDFGKEDLLAFVQKGVRMTQIGTELSKREQTVADRERVAESNALQVTQLRERYRPAEATKVESAPPKELQPSEYDTEDVKSVKQAALAMWKENQSQAQRLNAIEGGIQSQQTEAKTREFLDDLTSHKTDFPLASTEEVIAVHALRPDIPLADLVRRSHAIYGSIEHIKEVFKHAPEVRKAVEDEVIAAYLARNSKARVIPQKPSVQGTRSVPAAKVKISGFDSAGQAAKKAFARMIEGQEGDNE